MYGKPQPVRFTRTFICHDCSNQFRDPRVQSVLDFPPPPSEPLFCLVSKEPCMESPNQYLSPEPSFARTAPISFEIQGSKVCSTIHPLPPRHCFAWFQRNHVWKAPTSTFHQNLELPGLLQPVSRSKGPKCGRLSAPSFCTTVLVGFKGTMYGKPQPVPFTKTLNCQDCCNQFRDPRVQSVLDYPTVGSGNWLEQSWQMKVLVKGTGWGFRYMVPLKPTKRVAQREGARLSAPCHRHNKQSWAGSMNGCQQAVQVQLQFI